MPKERVRERSLVDLALSGAVGVGMGAGLMFAMDPARGRARRARARDRVARGVHHSEEALDTASRDLGHRMRGAVAELRSALRTDQASDDVVVERVRAKLGRVSSHPHAIEVHSDGGVVTLRGVVLADEAHRVHSRVAAVRGVHGVRDELERHANPDVSLLQGGRQLRSQGRRWTPAQRLFVGLVAPWAAYVALRYRRGLVLELLGAALIVTAVSAGAGERRAGRSSRA